MVHSVCDLRMRHWATLTLDQGERQACSGGQCTLVLIAQPAPTKAGCHGGQNLKTLVAQGLGITAPYPRRLRAPAPAAGLR